MRTKMRYLSINALRSEALFVSPVQRSDNLNAAQIRNAIAKAMREYGGGQCAARVAQEFGDHPEIAVERMPWARRLVVEAFDGAWRKPPAPVFASAIVAHGSPRRVSRVPGLAPERSVRRST